MGLFDGIGKMLSQSFINDDSPETLNIIEDIKQESSFTYSCQLLVDAMSKIRSMSGKSSAISVVRKKLEDCCTGFELAEGFRILYNSGGSLRGLAQAVGEKAYEEYGETYSIRKKEDQNGNAFYFPQ